MSLTREFTRDRIDSLAMIGACLMLVDTAWGGLAALGLDPSRTNEMVLGISLVLGFPAYLADLSINFRVPISLLGLFLFRWIATCFGGPTPVFCSPWRGSVLLILAFVLLELSKLRRKKAIARVVGISEGIGVLAVGEGKAIPVTAVGSRDPEAMK